MKPIDIINPAGRARLVLTCEHASCAIPREYDDLGLDEHAIIDHIGWDIGARLVTASLASELDATAVLSGVSRLVIDCNRDLCDHDLIIAESHGVRVPGNRAVDAEDRRRRIRDFYHPYHDAIDAVLAQRPGVFLFSVHSFTPELNGRQRRFDAGVLFDDHVADAERFGAALMAAGLRVRYNEPYSGLDGLIYSARTHGQRFGLRYLELEVNNALLRDERAARQIAGSVATALRGIVEG
ncbi:MAG TPA: N-formylglutamate amidohydrolase [Candidatus Acidoferrales bacterium]|nr:N-formylglutamate amidohydrolase [Candidatus Acidoferrales bacterium]